MISISPPSTDHIELNDDHDIHDDDDYDYGGGMEAVAVVMMVA